MTSVTLDKIIYSDGSDSYRWKEKEEVVFLFSMWLDCYGDGFTNGIDFMSVTKGFDVPIIPPRLTTIRHGCERVPDLGMRDWFISYFDKCYIEGKFVVDSREVKLFKIMNIYGCVKEPHNEYTKKYQEQIIYHKLQS
jgi:hypothetical protein